jgi:glycosyltransferase involved in cell wall biosynthesis
VNRYAPTIAGPKRVLFATVDSNWAGAQIQMLELAAGLDRAELEPVVLTTGRGGLIANSRAAGIRTYVVPYRVMRRHFPFFGYYAVGPAILRRILRRERIDLVHTHCPNSAVPLMNAARGLHLPLIAHIHDLDQRWVTPRSVRVLNGDRALVVAISDAAARDALARGVRQDHLRRVYNGVHLPPLEPGARERLRRDLGIGDDEIAVGLVGRLVRRKGAADLVRALAEPALRDLPVRVLLVGGAERSEADFESELRSLAATLGLERRITFSGPRGDAALLAQAFDIVGMPSRREAFGRAAIEAMHAGTPLVVYCDAALPELVRDDLEGIVVEPGNIGALAAAIARLAVDAGLRQRLGSAGRCRAREFGHERFVADVTALYRELLGSGRS